MRYLHRWTVAAAVAGVGCGGASSSLPVMDKSMEAAPAASPPTAAVAVGAADQATGGIAGQQPRPALSAERAAPAGSDPSAPSMIIRSGNASVQVDSLELAVEQLQSIVRRLGGYVANTSMQAGRDQVRSATLDLKIPAPRFEEASSGLSGIGTVEFVNVTAEDVGEEFVDVAARVANGRRLEERLIELLATRTGRLQDVLSVERELARVREEIDRSEGRLRYLKTRAAISTLSVTMHEPPPLVSDSPGSNIIARAFIQAWRNFVRLTAAGIASLGILLPLAVLTWAGIFLVRRMRRSR